MTTSHQIRHRNLRIMIVALGVLLILVFLHKCQREGILVERPDFSQRQQLTKEILDSKHLFIESFSAAKKAMPWLDSVIYEDVRQLVMNNNANEKTVSNVL